MVAGNLNTTNILLGIMAGVSLLQALVLIGAAIMGYRLYQQAMQAVRDIERRQVAPLTARVETMMLKVDGILGDVKDVTARVTSRTERVDSAIDHTIYRVDETAGHVRASIAASINRIVRLVQSATGVLTGLFGSRKAA
jgi:hypothetical protein